MWRTKKLIIIEVLVVVLLVATVGIVAVARADDENTAQEQSQNCTSSLMEKVAEIYEANTGTAIDAEELEKAFTQACQEIRAENRYQFLDKLVELGKITQEQADEFRAWLEERPDIFTDEFQQWMQSRPDILTIFGHNNDCGMMIFGGRNQELIGIGNGFGLRLHNCWSD